MSLIQRFPLIAIFFLSASGILIWLLIPLTIQVIIDKVIVQNTPDTLKVLGVVMLVVTLIASALEMALNTLSASFIHNNPAKDILLKLVATLPKVLAILVFMTVYNYQLAIASTVLTALACWMYYLLKKARKVAESSSEFLPLAFRLPLSLIVLFILWYGTSFVLNAQLTLGQLIALSIFNIQFVIYLLSLVAAIAKSRKNHEVEYI